MTRGGGGGVECAWGRGQSKVNKLGAHSQCIMRKGLGIDCN